MSEPDIRQADLWTCLDCGLAHANKVGDRACSACGGSLEYLGEIDYNNKDLVRADGGCSPNTDRSAIRSRLTTVIVGVSTAWAVALAITYGAPPAYVAALLSAGIIVANIPGFYRDAREAEAADVTEGAA